MSEQRGFEDPDSLKLSANEIDAIGEIGNICMGTSATALSTLLGYKVSITTPRVSIGHITDQIEDQDANYVSVEVSYIQGIEGSSVLLIKERDVFFITSILMGEEYDENADIKLDELHFSAISEVMNQMVGASATALSSIVKKPVNISPPIVHETSADDERSDSAIIIKFAMEIQNVLSSEIIQVMPYDFGKKLASFLFKEVMGVDDKPQAKPKETKQAAEPAQRAAQRPEPQESRVGVRSFQYESFDATPRHSGESQENIDFIMDVPLQVTVELGQCKKTIKEILSMSMGSVVVLDKLAGEMVDIFVNGKLFARGEVVVIDDNYGVRVTDIMADSKIAFR